MPQRNFVTKELAVFLSVLAHPHRIRIIEELRLEERDVNSLQTLLGISHSGVSQHLGILRAHRLVAERREGRRCIYHLCMPKLAEWLLEGMGFLQRDREATQSLTNAIEQVRLMWSASPAEGAPAGQQEQDLLSGN